MYSINLFLKLRTPLLIGPAVRLIIEKLLRMKLSKSFMHSSPDMISPGDLNLQSSMAIGPSQSFADISRARATSAVCAEPHASRWICCSVRQQSVAVFNKLWKQKLINKFNCCSQKSTTKISSEWRVSCQTDSIYEVNDKVYSPNDSSWI